MEISAENQNESPFPSNGFKSLLSFYSSYLSDRICTFFHVSIDCGNSLLSRIANVNGYSGRRCWKTFFPLPLPSAGLAALLDPVDIFEAHIILRVLEDVMEHTFQHLQSIQNNLVFWESKAQDSDFQKACFMVCGRGPCAFISGSVQLMRDILGDGHGVKNLYSSSSSHISERIRVLNDWRCLLAEFLAEVYVKVVSQDLNKKLLVDTIFIFLGLERSIPQKFRELGVGADFETRDVVKLIYENLHRLNTYSSKLVSNNCKPNKITLYWMRNSCVTFGIAFCSIWMLRHSKFMGSSDIDHWICKAENSTISFWKKHVKQPILSIRHSILEASRKRHKSAMEREEVQLAADSLHRMLLAFSEQTVGKKLPENASDKKMLEIVMARYEKAVMHPMRALVRGELLRCLIIQVQKLKLDIKKAMLELGQILRANEINFAILAALPAIFLSQILAMLVRAWFKKDSRGRVARTQRRLLLVEIERTIVQIQSYRDQGLVRYALYKYGMLLHFLNCLQHAVERPAKATGEWVSLRQDILHLANPHLLRDDKLRIVLRMREYMCLL